MPLSPNTLIHFTDTKDKLKSILAENFRVFNCKEVITLNIKTATYYAPMVSFCEIPLSQIKEHITKYGNYGIGLTREWGTRNKLNPVLYASQGSMLSKSFQQAYNHFSGQGAPLTNEQKALSDVLRYIKNYEADLTRKGKTIPNYRFADEREWRYVPHYSEACDMMIAEGYYLKPEVKAASEAKLDKLRLEFEPNDIKYIIINNDTEINEFIDHLKHAKGKKYTFHDVERLTTRILTAQQIMDDM